MGISFQGTWGIKLRCRRSYVIVMRRHIWTRGAIGGGWLDQTRPVGKSTCSFLPTRPSACSPGLLEVGHGARLSQRRHTVHTGLFKHVLPADFVCAGAVLLRGCVWLCERGCSLAAVSGRLQHWTLCGGLQDVPSVAVAHRLSCSSAHGVPQDHRLNPCLLHWLADSSPPGKPHIVALYKMMYS